MRVGLDLFGDVEEIIRDVFEFVRIPREFAIEEAHKLCLSNLPNAYGFGFGFQVGVGVRIG